MRAEEEVRRSTGNTAYEARQVIVVTWHQVAPLSALFFGLPSYVSPFNFDNFVLPVTLHSSITVQMQHISFSIINWKIRCYLPN